MQRNDSPKHFVIAFFIALAVYFASWHFIERRRSSNGAWEVDFISNSGRSPALEINQAGLQITNIEIIFGGATAPATNARVVFDKAREVPYATPFGECVFQDIIFEPGTVVIGFAGHQVQLMRRTMTIDGVERSWTNRQITLAPKQL
jgi:hypothetical protein